MRIGYACKCVAVPGTRMSACVAAKATGEHLRELIGQNLAALDRIMDYNIANDIRLFRISSDLIPFGSSALNSLDWAGLFAGQLRALGEKAGDAGIRLSMHPGQYTVINSPDPEVVNRAAADLRYHCRVLDAMGLSAEHKLILHIGGVYGEKERAIERFCRSYRELPDRVRERLVIENDERCYHIRDVYDIGRRMQIPVVFDNLHHQLNLPRKPEDEVYWLQLCKETWRQKDGPQKIHYAQQAEGKRPGAHSQAIRIEEFMDFIGGFPFDHADIMLEVKDKNQSAVKCMNYTRPDPDIRFLEKEWERYRYGVLSHSRKVYQQIEALLRDKNSYPVRAFYQLVSQALALESEREEQLNAMDHIWQYFKDVAEEREKRLYLKNTEAFRLGDISEAVVRRQLYRLAFKYRLENILYSYYFL